MTTCHTLLILDYSRLFFLESSFCEETNHGVDFDVFSQMLAEGNINYPNQLV